MSNLIVYTPPIEQGIAKIQSLLSQDDEFLFNLASHVSSRCLALLLLQKDSHLWQQLQHQETLCQSLEAVLTHVQQQLSNPIAIEIASVRHSLASEIEKETSIKPQKNRQIYADLLHKLTVNPITGFPILVVIIYLGVYKFVGEFAAGELVDLIETFFADYINPSINQLAAWLFPNSLLQDLIAKDYGIITMGIRYAIAIVLPIVTSFFLMFSLLEDSGYLPRLSLMLDRLFKSIGLSGRGVIPIILGLGCDTMATLVTRTLETKRERLITTVLLAVAVPCAAQWGVIVGLLAQEPKALLIWGGIIGSIFIIIGYSIAHLLPGNRANFYLEVPPLRIPNFQNVLKKTYARMTWYFWEIIPLFISASVIIWLGRLTGLFDAVIKFIEPICLSLGLPKESAVIFLYGFFRRDYGAAGLFDLHRQGILLGNQLVITAILLTLFLPCIAQLQIMFKERGWQTALTIVMFVFPFAFLTGYIVNQLFLLLGVNL